MEGACLCGGVKLHLDVAEDPLSFYCHCTHCRKVAGGRKFFSPSQISVPEISTSSQQTAIDANDFAVVGANLLVELDKVKVIGEENLKAFEDKGTDSGEVLHRYFCKDCGK